MVCMVCLVCLVCLVCSFAGDAKAQRKRLGCLLPSSLGHGYPWVGHCQIEGLGANGVGRAEMWRGAMGAESAGGRWL
jgi:hypothetical protein